MVLSAAFIAALILGPSLVLSDCGNNNGGGYQVDWIEYQDHCYHFTNFTMKFSQGVAYCAEIGSLLPSIHSEEENNFIKDHLGDWGWIGLVSSQDAPSTFEWLDGSQMDFQMWYPKRKREHKIYSSTNLKF